VRRGRAGDGCGRSYSHRRSPDVGNSLAASFSDVKAANAIRRIGSVVSQCEAACLVLVEPARGSGGRDFYARPSVVPSAK
jgi:hypothetical protein